MKLTFIALTLALSASIAGAQPYDTPGSAGRIDVIVNGRTVDFRDGTPVMRRGRLLVPLRSVLKSLPASAIVWDPARQVVTAAYGDRTARLEIGSRMATVNGRSMDLDVPATTIDGRTMVPLRFLSEALGAVVTYSEPDMRVAIAMPAITVPRGTMTPSAATIGSTTARRFFRSNMRNVSAGANQPLLTDDQLLEALIQQVRADVDQWAADRAEWASAHNNFILWANIQTTFNSMTYYNGSAGLNGGPMTSTVLLNPTAWAQWQATLNFYEQRDLLDQRRLATDYAAYVQVFKRVFPNRTPDPMPVL
jgi:hypothetical protein